MGFFELFVGDDPKWYMPDCFSPRHAEENALRFYKRSQHRLAERDKGID